MEYKKDFIMRTIQSLVSFILKILASIETQNEEKAQQDINTAFGLLGKSRDFFLSSNAKAIFEYLESIDDSYQSVLPVSQLIYCQAIIENNDTEKKRLLRTSKSILESYIDHTKILSTDALKFSKMLNLKLSGL